MTDSDAPLGQPDEARLEGEPLDRDLTDMLEALRDSDDAEPPGVESEGLTESGASAAEPTEGLFSQLLDPGFEPSAETTSVAEPVPASDGAMSYDHPWADGPDECEPAARADVTAVLPAIVDVPREVDLGPTKRGRWWVVALVVLGVVAAIGAGGYAWWWTTSRPVVVPDVVGKNPAQATQTLNDVGLRLGKVSEAPTDSAPAGTIISQRPEAGSRLKPDDSLSFVVAAAPEQAKVPDVAGVSAEQAASTLAEARLRPFEVASHDASVAAGFVVAQLPKAGTELLPGTAIAVVVSKGPAPASATVPRVTGMAENDAVTLLSALGLQARVYRSPDASLAVGVVGTQTPLPGIAAGPGAVVQLLVSQGAGTAVAVPGVTGFTRKNAAASIKAKGLVPDVAVVLSTSVARGKVISQMPMAGGRSVVKGIVGLLVSRGNSDSGAVPSVIGTASTEATGVVTEAGFRPVILTIAAEGQKTGVVFAQYPEPGAKYGFRLPVVCLVAGPKSQ